MADTHVLSRKPDTRVRRYQVAPAEDVRRASYPAYRILQAGFVLAPLIAGVDKFVHALADWPRYLAPAVVRLLPFSPDGFMRIVGVIEVAAAILVAVAPRVGAWVVAGWLGAIILNLLMVPGYYDIALRDFGLMLGAVALGLLARVHAVRPRPEPASRDLEPPRPREVPPIFPPL